MVRGGDPPPELIGDARCRFIVPRKNRRCGLQAASGGGGYCGIHAAEASEGSNDSDGQGRHDRARRVPCPIDPSHTVLASKLAKHVLKCPKKTEVQRLREQSFFREDCNLSTEGRTASGAATSTRAVRERMEAMLGPEFEALVARVSAAAARLGAADDSTFCCETPLELQPWLSSLEWLQSESRVQEPRHAVQRVSICGHVGKLFGLFAAVDDDEGAGKHRSGSFGDVSVVELGAGRGYVGAMLAEAGGLSHCVLNDVRSYRYKADRVLRKTGAARVERATCDLKDFCLSDMNTLQGRRCVVLGKHLCGGATDLALRCVAACRPSDCSGSPFPGEEAGGVSSGAPEGGGQPPRILALGIATCCHHRCTPSTYVGAGVLRENGFSDCDLENVFWLSSWATLKGGGHGVPEPPGRDDLYFSSLTLQRKVDVGRHCKQLLDAGRLEWLRRRGFSIKGVRYVDPEITPENFLLLAH